MSAPDFQRVQTQLAGHIRAPEDVPPPMDVEGRRLRIYRDLFYNNIAGFLASGFPVLKSLYDETAWASLVRDFLASHRCRTPYFLEISQEFLTYLAEVRDPWPEDPPFLLPLAHYEWVELALDTHEDVPPPAGLTVPGEWLTGRPQVSPTAWCLAYDWPVHRIGPGYRPETPLDEPVYLLVHRDPEDRVRFLEVNAMTARLLELLSDGTMTGGAALRALATEMAHPDPAGVEAAGISILEDLHQRGVILGTC